MKNIFLTCLSFIVASCSNQVFFDNYRNNPFQFPYPEYYLKADIENIESYHSQDHDMTIEAFNLKLNIDKQFIDEFFYENNKFIAKKSGKKVFIIMNEVEKFMGCNEEVRNIEKDFCSAFSSTKEYLEKLFLLTPDDLSKEKYLPVGNRWIVHNKGHQFKHVDNITIYRSDNFIAFRTDFNTSNNKTKIDLRIFHKKNSRNFQIFVFTEKNEHLVKSILETIQ